MLTIILYISCTYLAKNSNKPFKKEMPSNCLLHVSLDIYTERLLLCAIKTPFIVCLSQHRLYSRAKEAATYAIFCLYYALHDQSKKDDKEQIKACLCMSPCLVTVYVVSLLDKRSSIR